MVIMTGGHSTLSDDDALYRHPMPEITYRVLRDPSNGKTRLSIVCFAVEFDFGLRLELANAEDVDPLTPIGDSSTSSHIIVLDLLPDAAPDSVAFEVGKIIARQSGWGVYKDKLTSA